MKGSEHAIPEGQTIGGLVFDIQRFSLHDGPGIRTLVFLKGCPLKCIWCSNPESQKFPREIMFNASKCIDCGTCSEICPQKAIRKNNTTHRLDRNLCDACGNCCEECPTQALQWSGKYMSVAEVLAEIEKDREFYENSGGGVTFSGGEPVSQPEFLKNLLIECKAHGVHTATETCGFCQWEDLQNIMPFTDLFLYDLKHMDPVEHERLTGHDNKRVLENLEWLRKEGADIIIRMPIVPGLNDSGSNLTATAELMDRLKLKEIHLLPYHNYGESKYEMLGDDYSLKDLKTVSEQDLEAPKRLFEQYGLIVNIGGE
jgi:pyruvate formate lyase activating enzyme